VNPSAPETGVSSSEPEDRRARELGQARFVAREAGGAWLAQVLHGVLRYVGAFFAARILGVSAFGAYSLALAVTGIGTVVSDLGLSPGVLPFLSRARQAGDAARIRALLRDSLLLVTGAGTGVAILVFLAAPWLGDAVFHDPALPRVLRALAPLILLGATVGLLATFLQGFLAIKERAWIERVLVTGVTVAVLAAAWALGWGWPGVIAAMLLGPATGLAAGAVLLKRLAPRPIRSPASPRTRTTGELVAYSWPLLGSSMLVFLLLWSDVLVMGVFREADEVGVYGLCARLAGGVLLVQESIGQVFVPRLSDHFAAGDRDGMRHLYHLSTRWAAWPTVIAAAVLVVWGGPILALFAPGFAAGAAPLAVLAVAKAIGVASGMSGKVFAVTGHARVTFVNLILMVGCNIALNLLWIPRHGAMGAAAATLVSIAGVNALQVFQVSARLRLLPWDRRILWPLLGVPLLALLVVPFREGPAGSLGWLVPLAGFAGACVVLYLVRGVGAEEREVWRTIGNRPGPGGKA
jgi:O-antigen/teichoic acid export membrane protein